MRPLLLLLVLASGCGWAMSPKPDPLKAGTLEQVRSDAKGVCASFMDDRTTKPWIRKGERRPSVGDSLLRSTVKACARVRPGEQGAQGTPVLDVTFTYPTFDDRWRPEYWHVEVVRRNGLVVKAGSFEHGIEEEGVCLLDVCDMEGLASMELPEPWDADEYRIRLTHVPTRQRVDLSLSLR